MTNNEIWLKLLAEGKFSVTQKGEIINQVTKRQLSKGKVKSPTISFNYEGKWLTLAKGRAVWIARFGDISEDQIVRYRDSDPNNTHPDNIYCSDRSEQMLTQHRQGKMKLIDQNAYKNNLVLIKSNLDNAIVEAMRKTVKAGYKVDFDFVCKKYKVSRESVINAVRGKTFKYLKETPVISFMARKKGYRAKPKTVKIAKPKPIPLPTSAAITKPEPKQAVERLKQFPKRALKDMEVLVKSIQPIISPPVDQKVLAEKNRLLAAKFIARYRSGKNGE